MLVPTPTRGQYQSEDCDVGTSWESLQPQYDRTRSVSSNRKVPGPCSATFPMPPSSPSWRLTIIQTDNLGLRRLIPDKPHTYSRF